MHSTGKPLRAAWYSRVSSEAQAEAVTIGLQRDYAARFFALHQDDLTLVGTYEDDGVSGSIPVSERPGGKRLLADAKAGKFDVIIFYSFDRMVRSTLDLLQFHQMLEGIGVALRSASQPFDTTTAFGKAFMTLLAMVAELERHQIRDRTVRGRLRAVKNGLPPGGIAPLGYRWENQMWVIDEDEARIVRRIYKMIKEGATTVEVMRWLVAHNIPTTKEGRGLALARWTAGQVLKIARSPLYRGVFHFHTTKFIRDSEGKQRKVKLPESEWVTAQVPPIVDDATWYAVQAVIDSHKTHRKREDKHDYLLKGLVRCDVCGQSYRGSNSKHGRTKSYFYYRHSISNRLSGQPQCPGFKLFRADKLEAIVWQDIERLLHDPASFLGRLRSRLQDAPAPAQASLDPQALIEEKTAARTSIISLLARSRITEEEAEKGLLQLEGELQELEAERDAWAEQAFNAQRVESSLLEAGQLLERLRQSVDNPDAKRDIIRTLVREIRLIPNKIKRKLPTVEVHYWFESHNEPSPYIL